MENNYEKIMFSKTTEELIKITEIDKGDYQEEALIAAREELNKRFLTDKELESRVESLLKKKAKAENLAANTVSVKMRFFNCLADSLAWFLIAGILTLPLSKSNPNHVLLGSLILVLSYILYYTIFEIKYQKTIGKFITRTKVETVDGKVASATDIVIRTLCRFIPFDFVSFLFRRNGFHDIFSKTKVVKDR